MRIMLLLAAAFALAGCFGDDSGGGMENGTGTGTGTGTMGPADGDNGTPRQTVQVTITGNGAYLIPDHGSYDKPEVRVPANSTVELTFVNNDPVSDHDLDVEGYDANGPVIGPNEQHTITFDVGGPNTTAFFCSVGNHRQNGMQGTFIVE